MRRHLSRYLTGLVLTLGLTIALPAISLTMSVHTPAEMRQLRKSAGNGDVSAMLTLGNAYRYGQAPGFTSDDAWAAYWYGEAARLGSEEAKARLGDIYNDPEGPLYNETTAFAWYESAAEAGYLPAQSALARLWENPKSVPPDYTKAYKWFVKAAEQGDEQAYETLDGLYTYGSAVKSYADVFERLNTEAAAGDAEAQWRLGQSYMRGDARQDTAMGLQWLQKSADQGSAKGLYYMGAELMMGNGLPQDVARGLQMEKRAADLGYVPAQLYWAHNYPAEGEVPDEGVEKMIFGWWLAGAEKDYPEVQESLSYYYFEGKFAKQDKAEGWKWHLLSFRSPYRQQFRQQTLFPGPMVSLSEADKNEGRRRADIWLTAHPAPYWPRAQ